MLSVRIWGPVALVVIAAAAWDRTKESTVSGARPEPAARALAAEAQRPPAAYTPPVLEPVRVSAPRAHREALQPLAIAPLNPDLGLVVDRRMLEWLPAALDLRAGDAVLRINGEPMASTAQLLDAVRGASEGSAVELRVRRSTGDEVSYWASP
jgi:S1-C subfamily serine protease